MKKQVFKAILGVKRSPAELIAKTVLIRTNVADNATIFTTPNPSLAVLKTKSDAIADTVNEIKRLEQQMAVERSKMETQINALKSDLDSFGSYVEGVAKAANNPNLILMAGFDLPAESSTTTVVGVPNNVSLEEIAQTTGVLLLRLKPVSSAKGYVVAYCFDPTVGDWQEPQFFTSSANMRIKAPSGKRIYLHVKALGSKNLESDWSDIATRIVP